MWHWTLPIHSSVFYYESLIAPRSGISVLGNSAIYDAPNSSSGYPGVSVTHENALIAQKAAVCATNNWYECINPESIDFKYTLTYRVDSVDYKTYEVEYGTPIKPEEPPTREGYTFSGWENLPDTMPANDVLVTGSFAVNRYVLTYRVDSVDYRTYEMEYGTPIKPEEPPTREGYTFSGWENLPDTMPANDVLVTGSFIKQMLGKIPAPSINVVNGEIVFSCEEEDVKYHYEITNLGSKSGEGNHVKITNIYNVSVYASKDGYNNSDVVTKEVTFGGIKGDVNDDGKVNIVDATMVVDIILNDSEE